MCISKLIHNKINKYDVEVWPRHFSSILGVIINYFTNYIY